MVAVVKGSRTDLIDSDYTVRIVGNRPGLVDIAAVLLGRDGKVRSDNDFVFFNNPSVPGVGLQSDDVIRVDLARLPTQIERVVLTASTEAQNRRFADVTGLSVEIASARESFTFVPAGLSTETVLQTVAFYRRGAGWRLDAIGQGYSGGLAAFATEHGIEVDDAGPAEAPPSKPAAPPQPSAPVSSPTASAAALSASSVVDFRKVKITLDKTSTDKVARIDLRKSQGDPRWVLTVGLEWDGRGARYNPDGTVKKFGRGDLDGYFFCRNEVTNDYVVIRANVAIKGDSTGGLSFITSVIVLVRVMATNLRSSKFACCRTRTVISWSMCTNLWTTAPVR